MFFNATTEPFLPIKNLGIFFHPLVSLFFIPYLQVFIAEVFGFLGQVYSMVYSDWISFASFSFPITLAQTSKTTLEKNRKSGQSCLVPALSRNT